MKKFYIILVVIFLVIGFIVNKKLNNTFNKLDYLDKLDEDKDDFKPL